MTLLCDFFALHTLLIASSGCCHRKLLDLKFQKRPSHHVRRPLKGHLPSPARARGRFLPCPVEDEAAALTAQPVRQIRTGFADGEALAVRGFRSALLFGKRLQIAFYHFCYLVPIDALEKAAAAGNLRCIHNSLKQASGCFHTVAGVRLVPAAFPCANYFLKATVTTLQGGRTISALLPLSFTPS